MENKKIRLGEESKAWGTGWEILYFTYMKTGGVKMINKANVLNSICQIFLYATALQITSKESILQDWLLLRRHCLQLTFHRIYTKAEPA
jgi:hypothetical protein